MRLAMRARGLVSAGTVLAIAALTLSALVAPGLPSESGRGYPVAAAAAPSAAPVLAAPAPARRAALAVPPGSSWIATLASAVGYSRAPGRPAVGVVPALTPFGTPQVLAVVGAPRAGWLDVELPIRPNGTRGWIRLAGVKLSETTYAVHVDLEARTLTVLEGGRPVMSTSAAVGKPSTPTPAGSTYLWELIRPDDPYGAYGPYIFGLAWFSDAYSVFNGGDAQIGIHGQDEPWSIGEAVSHGCIRLPNAVITELASMLPLGTPVSIS